MVNGGLVASGYLAETIQTHSRLDLSDVLNLTTASIQNCGGSCDVYRCDLVSTSTLRPHQGNKSLGGLAGVVAVKRLRYFGCSDSRTEKSIAEELGIWASLDHPNVIPLKGFACISEWGPYPAFISDWMANGTVDRYIQENANVDILSLVKGIVGGLKYLHSRNVIHSDLKCANVLVSPTGQPLLSDFGISRRLIPSSKYTSRDIMGTLRWCAPELLSAQLDEPSSIAFERSSKPTMESDIWALGMTILEIITKDIPYGKHISDIQVLGLIFRGILPRMPQHFELGTIEQFLLNTCKDCWNHKSKFRPSANAIEQVLNGRHQLLLTNDGDNIDKSNSNNLLDDFQVVGLEAREAQGQLLAFQESLSTTIESFDALYGSCNANRYSQENLDSRTYNEIGSTIPKLQQSLLLAFHEYPKVYALVCALGDTFYNGFLRSGDLDDLNIAISYLQCITPSVTSGGPNELTWLFKLTRLYMRRFDLFADIRDLQYAISLGLQVKQSIPDDHSEWPTLLCSLAFMFGLRFERSRDWRDLEDGISYYEEGISTLPSSDLSRRKPLLNLSLFYSLKFSLTNAYSDVSLAIIHQYSSIELTPDSHESKPNQYMILVGLLLKRVEITNCQASNERDFTNAIRASYRALTLTPQHDNERFSRMFRLGTLHRMRHLRFGDIEDLHEAINQQLIVHHVPDSHPKKPEWQYELAKSFLAKHNIDGQLDDLTHAIFLLRRALDHTEHGNPSEAMRSSTLGFALHVRYCHTGGYEDLYDALEYQRLAVRLAPSEPMFPACLALILHARYKEFGFERDLCDAIDYQKQAVQLTKDGHPQKSKRIFLLNSLLHT